MIALNAHFDGKVIVPDEPLALRPNQKLRVSIEPIEPESASADRAKLELGLQRGVVTYLAPDWDEPLPEDI